MVPFFKHVDFNRLFYGKGTNRYFNIAIFKENPIALIY